MTKWLGAWSSTGAKIRTVICAATCTILMQASAYGLTVDEIAHLKGGDRQEILEDGARQEGTVTLYTNLTVNQALRPLAAAFEKKYPFIKFEYWVGQTTDIVLKANLEHQAGALHHDFIENSSDGLMEAISDGLVQSFYSPSLSDYPPALYDAKNGLWAGTRNNYFGLGYNTNIVSAAEVPRTYQDLLDPKWRGKMTWSMSETDRVMFISNILVTMGDKAGSDYIRKLSTQQILPYAESARSLLDQVGQGEYPMILHVFANFPLISRALGAPLATSMLEPVDSEIAGVQLAKDAPHPYAAMLAIDFFLSREGQTIYRDANYFAANPRVDPKDDVRSLVPRLNNMKETIFTPELAYSIRPRTIELIKKYFDN